MKKARNLPSKAVIKKGSKPCNLECRFYVAVPAFLFPLKAAHLLLDRLTDCIFVFVTTEHSFEEALESYRASKF